MFLSKYGTLYAVRDGAVMYSNHGPTYEHWAPLHTAKSVPPPAANPWLERFAIDHGMWWVSEL